jgi:hypothetical protein
MSQLLLIEGEDPVQVAGLYRRAVSCFRSHWYTEPHDQLVTPSVVVAVFARFRKPAASRIVRARGSGEWICGAGTWFYQDETGERALQRILEDPKRSADLPDAWLQDVDGQFAIALGDHPSGNVLVITDRLGMLHVYAALVGSSVIICTSSLVLAILTQSTWDHEGCRQFLVTNMILEPSRTLFERIRKLEPATVFKCSNGNVRQYRRYWHLTQVMDRGPGDPQDHVPRLAAALRDTLAVVHKQFPRPLMDFTGGFDTRGLLGAALNLGVTVEAVVNGPSTDADVKAAMAIADAFGIMLYRRFHTFASAQEWWEQAKATLLFSDGECDVLYYAGALFVHSLMAECFDASIVGIDGEIVQGKWWELLFPFTGRRTTIDPHLFTRRRLLYDGEEPGLLAHRYPERLEDHVVEVIRSVNRDLDGYPNSAQVDHVYLTIVQQRLYGRVSSATQRIWPCISPYGFRVPLEIAVSAPPKTRVRRRMSRRLIEYQNPRLAAFPTEEGYPALPLRLSTAHRFWPLVQKYAPLVLRRLRLECGIGVGRPSVADEWTSAASNGLRAVCDLEEVRDLLDPKQMVTHDLYQIPTLRRVISEKRVGANPGTYLISRILTLELLARILRASS